MANFIKISSNPSQLLIDAYISEREAYAQVTCNSYEQADNEVTKAEKAYKQANDELTRADKTINRAINKQGRVVKSLKEKKLLRDAKNQEVGKIVYVINFFFYYKAEEIQKIDKEIKQIEETLKETNEEVKQAVETYKQKYTQLQQAERKYSESMVTFVDTFLKAKQLEERKENCENLEIIAGIFLEYENPYLHQKNSNSN